MSAISLTVSYASRSGGASTPRVSFTAPLEIPDDAAPGFVISQAVAYGQTGSHSFSLTANAGGRFAINAAGQLRVGSTALGEGPYSITVRATNGSDPAITTTRSVFIQAAAPSAPIAGGGLADRTFTIDGGVRTVNVAGDFSHATDGSWSLPTAPAGVSIDAAGVVQVDTGATGLLAGASVLVRFENALGAAESGFSLTIEEAVVFSGPPHAPSYFWDFSDASSIALSGEEVQSATDQIGGVVATAGGGPLLFKPDATAEGGPKARLFFRGLSQLTLPNTVALNSRSVSVFVVTRMNHNQWRKNRSTLLSLGSAARDFILMKNQSQALSVFTAASNFADISNSNGASVSWAIGSEEDALIGSEGDVYSKGSPFPNRNAVGGWIGRFTSTDSNRGFSGDMQGVLIYDRALSESEREEVLTWLSTYYPTPGLNDREYILDGDSITEGVGAGVDNDDASARVDFSYPAQLQLIPSGPTPRVHNTGVGGALINDQTGAAKVLERLAASRSTNDRIVFGLYGNNDIAGAHSAADIAADYEVWMANIRAAHPDVRIGIGTVLKTTRWDPLNIRETNRLAFNEMVRKNTGSMTHDFFIDTEATPELQAPSDTTYLTDGIHLTTAGYAALAATVRAGLDAQP